MLLPVVQDSMRQPVNTVISGLSQTHTLSDAGFRDSMSAQSASLLRALPFAVGFAHARPCAPVAQIQIQLGGYLLTKSCICSYSLSNTLEER